MIGRRATKELAELAFWRFAKTRNSGLGRADEHWIHDGEVYEFFYEHGFSADFCNVVRFSLNSHHRNYRDFVLKLHTGESVRLLEGKKDMPVEAAELAGQVCLRQIAEAFLRDFNEAIPEDDPVRAVIHQARRNKLRPFAAKLVAALELDGYTFRAEQLIHRESSPIDAEKHRDLLVEIAKDLGLVKIEVLEHCLKLSEDAYHAGRWDDCVSNARRAMESAFQECASSWERRANGKELSNDTYERAAEVRKYLQQAGLLNEKEQKALAASYGLLSDTGSHPNIAQSDQARMSRQLALILSEFVMLRTAGALKARGS